MAARDDRRWRASAAALALVIVALNVDLRTGPTGPVGSVRSLARSAVFPMQRGFAAIPAPLSLIFGNKRLQRENDELREQVEELKGNEVRTDELERQVRELTALSDLTFAPDLPGVTAEIVVLSASNFEQTVQIDKGSDDGITVGSAVVGPAGLIGRVDEVSGARATVLLLTDPSFQVGVRVGAQGEVAVARGAGARRALRVSLVAPSAAIRKGDSVVTSGLNGSPFPAGVPVGVLGSVTREVGDLDLNVSLDPVADLAHARYVRVLRWESS